MSNVKISADVRKIVRSIEKYRKNLEKFISNTVNAVAEAVANAARPVYGSAVRVNVEPVQHEDTLYSCFVTAEGKAVVFLEFGAGDYTDSGHPFAPELAKQAAVYVRAGQWSSTEGLGAKDQSDPRNHPNYASDGYWFFGGRFYNGVLPRRALFNAVQSAMAKTQGLVNKQYDKVMQ